MIYIQDGNKQERDKYHEIWTEVPEYRNNSPGLKNVDRFMEILDPEANSTVIDIGCGEGKAGKRLEELGLRSWYLDITDAAKPEDISDSKFILKPIWGNWKYPFAPGVWDYGFCVDVMEHIPPEYTMLCLDRVIKNCQISYFSICLIPDGFGESIGETLHMTVRPFDWWLVRLGTLGKVVEARDLLNNGLYVVER